MILRNFFKTYIDGTLEKAIVANRKMFLCHITQAVLSGIEADGNLNSVYVTSRSLKHLFDKKPAEEFMFLLDNLHKIVKYPDKIYRNKDAKRGSFCFIKRIGDFDYLCSLEIVTLPFELGATELGSEKKEIQIATAFRLRDDKYIKNYTLLWDWGNGTPHRSALDAPVKGSTSAPQ